MTCIAGTSSAITAAFCTDCEAGFSSPSNAASCTACPESQVCPAASSSCFTCPADHSPLPDLSGCWLSRADTQEEIRAAVAPTLTGQTLAIAPGVYLPVEAATGTVVYWFKDLARGYECEEALASEISGGRERRIIDVWRGDLDIFGLVFADGDIGSGLGLNGGTFFMSGSYEGTSLVVENYNWKIEFEEELDSALDGGGRRESWQWRAPTGGELRRERGASGSDCGRAEKDGEH